MFNIAVIIYVGILFAFLVVCMFITILTPSIRKEDVLLAEQRQFPDEFWRKMRRQSYLGNKLIYALSSHYYVHIPVLSRILSHFKSSLTPLGLGAMLFSNFVVIGAIIAMGVQSQKAEKNRGKPKSALVEKVDDFNFRT